MNGRSLLVVAPHPDDEVLGVGGTIAKRASEGDRVHVVIVTRATPPLYTEEVLATGRREARAAQQALGVADSTFLSFPAAGLDTVPHGELNAGLAAVFAEVCPDVVFVPFNGDMHSDHQLVFTSALVCSRPGSGWSPTSIYAYETLSETNWNAPYLTPNFVPNVFVDISQHLETKLTAMRHYASQLKEFPHERSIEALRVLAARRGSTVGLAAAEAFVLVRNIH